MKIVYLYPKTSFISQYDSDFLFGLFLSVLRNFNSEEYTNSIIEKFESDEPPFLVSNCFYFIDTNNFNKELYFPKPIISSKLQEVDSIGQYSLIKGYKNKKYIKHDDFLKIIKGEITDTELFNNYTTFESKNRKIGLFKQVSTPHVQINRLNNSSEEGHFFHTEDTFINNGGLFFLFDGDFSIIEPILRFLNHYGLGADTSLGKGHFKVEFEDFEIPIVNDPTCCINLSSYYPTKKEIEYFRQNSEYFFYEVSDKTGKINTSQLDTVHFEKKRVNFLSPGSIYPIIENKRYYGCLQDVLEVNNIKIKFNGYSFAIPAKIKVD